LTQLKVAQTPHDMLDNQVKLDMAIKGSLTRHARAQALKSGALSGAVLTAVFDLKTLFDGQFLKYLVDVSVGAGTGAANGFRGSLLKDVPVLGNGFVIGVLVSTVVNGVGVGKGGDWARFGNNFGIYCGAAAASWGGVARRRISRQPHLSRGGNGHRGHHRRPRWRFRRFEGMRYHSWPEGPDEEGDEQDVRLAQQRDDEERR
jgi:hypothetical protein